MSPSIGRILVLRPLDNIIALHSLSTLNKLNSEISNKIMNLGLLSSSCLTISEPIEPPAPEIKKVLSLQLFITSRSTLVRGNKSSRDRF